MSKSCVGCRFMMFKDRGWSNYTVEYTDVHCLLDKNRNLPADEPWDWKQDVDNDNWPFTNESRCDSYSGGNQMELDVDMKMEERNLESVDEDVREAYHSYWK